MDRWPDHFANVWQKDGGDAIRMWPYHFTKFEESAGCMIRDDCSDPSGRDAGAPTCGSDPRPTRRAVTADAGVESRIIGVSDAITSVENNQLYQVLDLNLSDLRAWRVILRNRRYGSDLAAMTDDETGRDIRSGSLVWRVPEVAVVA